MTKDTGESTTNHNALWRLYTERLFTDPIYLQLAWYFCVSAALQRRVWIGDLDSEALFPNLYILNVGPPASGKSLSLMNAADLLRHHRRERPDTVTEEEWQHIVARGGHTLFHQGPDATSYEAILRELALTTELTNVRAPTPDNPAHTISYAHASLYFALNELKSLLKPHNKAGPERKIGDLLIHCFDCRDYVYRLKHQPDDVIMNPCVTFAASCVPDTLMEAAKIGVFNDGLMSRFITVFGTSQNNEDFMLPKLTQQQRTARDILLNRLLKLANVSGEMEISDEALEFISDWWKKNHIPQLKTAHPRYLNYLTRRRVHFQKLAMCIHLSDYDDMVITADDFRQVIKLLDPIETRMQKNFYAFGGNLRLPHMNNVLESILSFNGQTLFELYEFHKGDMDLETLQGVLNELLNVGKIKKSGDRFLVAG